MAKETEKIIYVRVSPQLHAAISRIAELEKRSITNQAEYILDKYAHESLGKYEIDEIISEMPLEELKTSVEEGRTEFANGGGFTDQDIDLFLSQLDAAANKKAS